MVLYINGCVRVDSRTEKLAQSILDTLGEYTELKLTELNLNPLDSVSLEKRTKLINKNNYEDKMFDYAKQFAFADVIVMSAPFWDGSFPAIVKTYLENIYVTGIVSRYSSKGEPEGLCQAKILYYVTTAGGKFIPDYSYNYIRDLATVMFGIKQTKLIFAENLDIFGNDPEKIINQAIEKYKPNKD